MNIGAKLIYIRKIVYKPKQIVTAPMYEEMAIKFKNNDFFMSCMFNINNLVTFQQYYNINRQY